MTTTTTAPAGTTPAGAHQWQRSRFTLTTTCAACGLLPLDEDDTATPCTGSEKV